MSKKIAIWGATVLTAMIGFWLGAHSTKASDSKKLDGLTQFFTEDGNVQLMVPKGWETASDLYGADFSILGPWNEQEHSRPALTAVAIPIEFVAHSNETIPKVFQDSYLASRKQALEEQNGHFLSSDPWSKKQFGRFPAMCNTLRYLTDIEDEDSKVFERTCLIECKHKTWNVKAMYRPHETQYAGQVDQIMESFSCL